MIAWAVRFEHGISAKLQALGCRRVEKIDDYHSLWEVIATKQGFSVPEFDGDKCPEVMWPDVLASVAKAKLPPQD